MPTDARIPGAFESRLTCTRVRTGCVLTRSAANTQLTFVDVLARFRVVSQHVTFGTSAFHPTFHIDTCVRTSSILLSAFVNIWAPKKNTQQWNWLLILRTNYFNKHSYCYHDNSCWNYAPIIIISAITITSSVIINQFVLLRRLDSFQKGSHNYEWIGTYFIVVSFYRSFLRLRKEPSNRNSCTK